MITPNAHHFVVSTLCEVTLFAIRTGAPELIAAFIAYSARRIWIIQHQGVSGACSMLTSDEALLVATDPGQVMGVLSLHFLPQLALAGDIGRISYFCVDDRARGGAGVGRRLPAEANAGARKSRLRSVEGPLP